MTVDAIVLSEAAGQPRPRQAPIGRPTGESGHRPIIGWLPWLVALAMASMASPEMAGASDSADSAIALPASIVVPLREAEAELAEGEHQIAESRFRSAMYEGWLLLGTLDAVAGNLDRAAEAFELAGRAAVERRRAVTSLAVVRLHQGRIDDSIRLLGDLLSRNPDDHQLRRLMAQARVAAGRPEEAVQDLETAHAAAPEDLELAFTLATGYLRLERTEDGQAVLDTIARARPGAATHVLIGRTYRDFGLFELAGEELEKAIALDPQASRAHYYMGTNYLLSEGRLRLDEAIGHFETELANGSKDPLVYLYLGMSLTEARRFEEALEPLRSAAVGDFPPADAHHFLGRCLLGLGRPAEALEELKKALDLAGGQEAEEDQMSSIHYQLANAYRRSGDSEAAEIHFAEARQYMAQLTETSRERLSKYLNEDEPTADQADEHYLEQRVSREAARPDPSSSFRLPSLDSIGLAGLDEQERLEVHRTLASALARVHLNLGILLVRGQHHGRAAEMIGRAAKLDPELPRVQYSLGVAHFNAEDFVAATAPLAKALDASPDDTNLRRMLALSWLNLEDYPRAAELLAVDPLRAEDPALEYAYALSLVRSDRSAEAGPIFDRLLQGHQRWPELHVLLGQALAQDGNFPAAIDSLKKALELDPEVPEASGSLGILLLRQGDLPGAEAAFRAESAIRPSDLRNRYNLATVLDLQGASEAARVELRNILDTDPSNADARYLLGKIHLQAGDTEAALAQLEAAAALAPQDPNIFNQLGLAYQKAGQPDRARAHFERFRQLKQEQRSEEGSDS